MSKDALPKDARDNRALQLNPTHPNYHLSRGASVEDAARAAEQARSADAPQRGDGDGKQPLPTPGTTHSVSPTDSAAAQRGAPERVK